jgi:hypothetical protein
MCPDEMELLSLNELRWSASQETKPHHGSNVIGPMPGCLTLRRRVASLGVAVTRFVRVSDCALCRPDHLPAQAMTRVPPEQAVPTGGAPAADSGDVKTNPVLTQRSAEVPAVKSFVGTSIGPGSVL